MNFLLVIHTVLILIQLRLKLEMAEQKQQRTTSHLALDIFPGFPEYHGETPAISGIVKTAKIKPTGHLLLLGCSVKRNKIAKPFYFRSIGGLVVVRNGVNARKLT